MPRILRWLAITPPQAGFKPASTETLRVLATLDDTARAASSLGPWLGTNPSANCSSPLWTSAHVGAARPGAAGNFYIIAATEFRRRGWPEGANEWH